MVQRVMDDQHIFTTMLQHKGYGEERRRIRHYAPDDCKQAAGDGV